LYPLFLAGPNLGLILGISLGLGIPALFAVIAGLVYYCKRVKNKIRISIKGTDVDNSTRHSGYQQIDTNT
jgi:hypothetical protein